MFSTNAINWFFVVIQNFLIYTKLKSFSLSIVRRAHLTTNRETDIKKIKKHVNLKCLKKIHTTINKSTAFRQAASCNRTEPQNKCPQFLMQISWRTFKIYTENRRDGESNNSSSNDPSF